MLLPAIPGIIFMEAVWRGLLQPELVGRFGVKRGVFLVGLIWGALRIARAMSSGDFPGEAVVNGLWIFAETFILCALLGWIVLRSGSVLPAILLHLAYRSFAHINIPLDFHWRWVASVGVYVAWAVAAWWVWRKWPVEETKGSPEPEAGPVPA